MKKSESTTRRNFIKQSTIGSTAIILPTQIFPKVFSSTQIANTEDIHISIFSKQLQFLDYKGMSESAKEMGFDGIDLTIRRKGHVLPERVVDDLPKATEAMKSYGLKPNLFSTNVSNSNNLIDRKVLETASQLGYKYYRTAWYKYKEGKDVLDTVESAKIQLSDLAKLNSKLNLTGGYQNHSGHYVGSAIWDLQMILKELKSSQMGSQYDIMHATVEGGKNWEIGFSLIIPYINTLVLKDFVWKRKGDKWKVQYVPLGEGMVDFNKFFSLLKQHKMHVPFTIHVEYDLGGAEHGHKSTMANKEVFSRIKKDLDFAREAYKNA